MLLEKFKNTKKGQELLTVQTYYAIRESKRAFIITQSSYYDLYRMYEPIMQTSLHSFQLMN